MPSTLRSTEQLRAYADHESGLRSSACGSAAINFQGQEPDGLYLWQQFTKLRGWRLVGLLSHQDLVKQLQLSKDSHFNTGMAELQALSMA